MPGRNVLAGRLVAAMLEGLERFRPRGLRARAARWQALDSLSARRCGSPSCGQRRWPRARRGSRRRAASRDGRTHRAVHAGDVSLRAHAGTAHDEPAGRHRQFTRQVGDAGRRPTRPAACRCVRRWTQRRLAPGVVRDARHRPCARGQRVGRAVGRPRRRGRGSRPGAARSSSRPPATPAAFATPIASRDCSAWTAGSRSSPAHATTRGACCVADVGTAATFDAVTRGGEHLGGFIVPGPELMVRSLHGGTADLAGHTRGQRPAGDAPLADNTRDAIERGCWLAVAALIDLAWRTWNRGWALAPSSW